MKDLKRYRVTVYVESDLTAEEIGDVVECREFAFGGRIVDAEVCGMAP